MVKQLRRYISEIKLDLQFRSKWASVDFSQLNSFVLFLGNPRSGTTLVRSIIDAHPNAVIANELHVLKLIGQGESWQKIYKKICLNASRFSENPVWTDYSYEISGFDKSKRSVFVIGDKRSAGSIHAIDENIDLIQSLKTWTPFPIKVIRCVRNPYDVIATRTRRNDLNLEENIDRYFFLENEAEKILQIMQPTGIHYVYSEKLITNAEHEISNLMTFLSLPHLPEHISACKKIIYPTSNKSRFNSDWTTEQIELVEKMIKMLPHLMDYAIDGKSSFE